jgi:vacuolar protein sorting-associated protein 18
MALNNQALLLLKENLHTFLEENEKCLDSNTVFEIMQSHGQIDECIQYAERSKNYETVIVHYLNKKDFETALHKISEITD